MKVPGTNVSLLSHTSVLSCASWSLPAGPGVCAGFNLEPDSTCHHCYAAQGRYRMRNVQDAQAARLQWWKRSGAEEKIRTLSTAIRSEAFSVPYFRVFDSGDFTVAEDVHIWREIARACPEVKFWISTRAWRDPACRAALEQFSEPNVVIRHSDRNGAEHKSQVVTEGFGCPKQQVGSCGEAKCRACWDPNVQSIEYKRHGNRVNWKGRAA